MLVREITEENEQKLLSEHACLARFSRGRFKPEAPCELRTVFQRDRDRIIHCNAFRRLMHKTQVFLAPGGRPLPHPSYPHAGGSPDCQNLSARPALKRGI